LHIQVVHCDLKAANILTTKRGNIKLSDFGVSLNLRAVENSKNEVAGSPNWSEFVEYLTTLPQV
jgi:serine/threonine protein kinase